MGVHDLEKYPEVKALLGIPDDEPIFILRAQDEAALNTLKSYEVYAHDVGASKTFLDGVVECSNNFASWKSENKDSVKVPD